MDEVKALRGKLREAVAGTSVNASPAFKRGYTKGVAAMEAALDEVIGTGLPSKYACHCGRPMVPTSAFRQCELYCLECGDAYGMFSPWAVSEEATEELHQAFDEVMAEWDEHVKGKIIPDGHQHSYSSDHQAADKEARIWLRVRAGEDVRGAEEAEAAP